MKCQTFPFFAAVFALILSLGLSSLHAAGETVLDTATIEAITGLKGRFDLGGIHDPKTVRCRSSAQRLALARLQSAKEGTR
jgi:hypothetical protein